MADKYVSAELKRRTEVYSQREGGHVLVLHLSHLVLSIIDKQGLLKTVNQTKG